MNSRQQTGQLLLKVSSAAGDYKPLGIPKEDCIGLDDTLRVKLFKDNFSTNQGKNGFYLEIIPKGDGVLNYVSQSIISDKTKDFEGRQQSRYVLGDGIHYKDQSDKSFSGKKKANVVAQIIETLFWGKPNELNGVFDERFSSDFVNEKSENSNFQYVRNEVEEKFQLISSDLEKNIGGYSVKDESIDIEENKCKYMPLNDANKSKFIATLHKVLNAQSDNTKYLFFVTDSRPESDEKVEKVHLFYSPIEDNEKVKILVLSSKVQKEYSVDLKKKSLSPQTKIGLAVVAAGIITAGLMVWQAPSSSKSELAISKKEQTTSKTDSLSLYKNLAAKYLEAVEEANRTIDSLKNLQYYTDTVNNTTVQIDIGEFAKTGVCAIHTVNDSTVSDTIVIRSNVDFIKTKKCYINIYKNSDTKPFKQIAPVDIKDKKK